MPFEPELQAELDEWAVRHARDCLALLPPDERRDRQLEEVIRKLDEIARLLDTLPVRITEAMSRPAAR